MNTIMRWIANGNKIFNELMFPIVLILCVIVIYKLIWHYP